MKAVMVFGTTSGAGKSFLTTALCRFFYREGYRVAPFKAQNMSNNARVALGGEIGSAQYFQALAAGLTAEVRMNPILLKPEADTRSQVVVMGKVRHDIAEIPWKERHPVLWPLITQALDGLMRDHDLIVIEGAGSPTEINLMSSDLVNLPVARYSDAATLLVTDIDRGGAFAHLYGTFHFMPADDRSRLKGFVLNRFRGDKALLEPGPSMLELATGIPTLATLPMWREHGLPEEDALPHSPRLRGGSMRRIFVIAYPYISNHDEFQSLINFDQADLIWARSPSELASLTPLDWIILPGSKQTQKDLVWLKRLGLDHIVRHHADRGGVVLGICGGLQMLGLTLEDPSEIESLQETVGLGLLSIATHFQIEKTVRRGELVFPEVRGAFSALTGVGWMGYEIHQGQSFPCGDEQVVSLVPGQCFQNQVGNVLGIYCHGLFESSEVMRALFGRTVRTLDDVFDDLGDFLLANGGRDTWLRLLD